MRAPRAKPSSEIVDLALERTGRSRSVDAIDSGKLRLAGRAYGAGKTAAGDVGVKSDIVSYSQASGLFAGATIDGMTVSSDDEAARALYGMNVDLASILERRAQLPQPDAVQRFLGTVNSAFAPAAVGEGTHRSPAWAAGSR